MKCISINIKSYKKDLNDLVTGIEDSYFGRTKDRIKLSRTYNSNSALAHLSLITYNGESINMDALKESVKFNISYSTGASYEIR